MTKKVIVDLRKESKAAPLAGADDKCTDCDSKWSLFEKHAEDYALFFRQCAVCDKYYCGFCVGSDDAMAHVHQPMCRKYRQLEEAAKELVKVNQQLTARAVAAP